MCCRLFPKEFIIEVFILSAITYAFHKFASFEVYPGEMNHIQQQEMKALFRSSTCEYHEKSNYSVEHPRMLCTTFGSENDFGRCQ